MPAFGVTMARLRAAPGDRLRAGGHDLRLGAQRLEAGRELRPRRLHRVIHGKHYHEETKATASQVTKYPGGRYLVVLNMDEARIVCDFIEHGGDVRGAGRAIRQGGLAGVRLRARPGAGGHRQPDHDALGRVAGDRGRDPPQHGAALRRETRWRDHFRSFDTICSATQERQDAVVALHRGAARRDGRGGRLQLEQHLPPRRARAARRACASSTSRMPTAWTRWRGRSATSRSAPSTRSRRAGWLGAAPGHRHHRRRLDAEQQDRRDDRSHLRAGRRRGGAAHQTG